MHSRTYSGCRRPEMHVQKMTCVDTFDAGKSVIIQLFVMESYENLIGDLSVIKDGFDSSPTVYLTKVMLYFPPTYNLNDILIHRENNASTQLKR